MIKIDREFVGGVVDNPKNQGICKAIMGMAHALDITVVAEGIETQEQHEFMRTAGCPLGQGYLYSAPLKAQDFESWVQRQR
jgi:EAL domain-containing protein (putative c-di-GMP-specific phosphodiesterase class I)